MNIQRQYPLPNCTLTLDGMGDGTDPSPTAPLSIILNARCQFVGSPQTLEGGRAFLEALAKAANVYAQQCLSGLPHPMEARGEEGEWVEITPLSGQALHRLIWHPPTGESSEPVSVDLTAVQLFDLVEAVDQFIGDRQTLPDFAVTLEPLARRYRQPEEPLVQRAVPPALGMISLGIFAAVLYVLPIPEVRKPEPRPPSPPSLVEPSTDGTTPPPSP